MSPGRPFSRFCEAPKRLTYGLLAYSSSASPRASWTVTVSVRAGAERRHRRDFARITASFVPLHRAGSLVGGPSPGTAQIAPPRPATGRGPRWGRCTCRPRSRPVPSPPPPTHHRRLRRHRRHRRRAAGGCPRHASRARNGASSEGSALVDAQVERLSSCLPGVEPGGRRAAGAAVAAGTAAAAGRQRRRLRRRHSAKPPPPPPPPWGVASAPPTAAGVAARAAAAAPTRRRHRRWWRAASVRGAPRVGSIAGARPRRRLRWRRQRRRRRGGGDGPRRRRRRRVAALRGSTYTTASAAAAKAGAAEAAVNGAAPRRSRSRFAATRASTRRCRPIASWRGESNMDSF